MLFLVEMNELNSWCYRRRQSPERPGTLLNLNGGIKFQSLPMGFILAELLYDSNEGAVNLP
jgi:hypothetical protein